MSSFRPEVEDRVHHPRHRELGAGADAHEERVRRVAEALAGLALDLLDRLEDVVPQPVGELLAVREVVVARFGRDRETGRDGQPGVRHLGQSGALAAEQVAHRRIALGATAAPGVDVALRGSVGPVGTGCGGRGHGASSSGAAARAPRNGLRCRRNCTRRSPPAPRSALRRGRKGVSPGPFGPAPGSRRPGTIERIISRRRP